MSVADPSTASERRVKPGKLEGLVALVTGASGGLGSAIAEALALEGANVVCTHASSADKAEAETTVAAVEAAGCRGVLTKCDVTQEADVAAAVALAVSELGRLDLCVAVAGVGKMGPFLTTTTADFELVHKVNVQGTYLTMREAGKAMASAGGGRIVTISSVHGLGGTHYNAIYGSSKAAIIALTKGAAFDLADHGIRVNCIAPGAVPVPNDPVPTSQYPGTDAEGKPNTQPTEMTKTWMRCTPLKRWGDPADIARTAVFLCSDDSAFMTGQVLQVDGGLSAGVGIPSFRDFASNHRGLPDELKTAGATP
eukprot:m.429116 g.429116  ORF g.429116 m.429116 type:complete len:310 (+) comp16961_c0_seq1:5787-6716(+)